MQNVCYFSGTSRLAFVWKLSLAMIVFCLRWRHPPGFEWMPTAGLLCPIRKSETRVHAHTSSTDPFLPPPHPPPVQPQSCPLLSFFPPPAFLSRFTTWTQRELYSSLNEFCWRNWEELLFWTSDFVCLCWVHRMINTHAEFGEPLRDGSDALIGSAFNYIFMKRD